jgi:hypothetical protein
MEYFVRDEDKSARPKSSSSEYLSGVSTSVENFLIGNKVIDLIEKNEFTIHNYHSLLKNIFHQVYFSSTSFAIAGSMASNISTNVRDYLFHHAEEEKEHWKWILEDLEATGYKGTDPRNDFTSWASYGYLSFGVYLGFFNPIGRLAMANVLEGISGKFGLKYGKKVLDILGLKKEQAKFFLLHGELDQGHSHDIEDIILAEKITDHQWAEMKNICLATSELYKNIYNLSAVQVNVK